MKPCNKCGVSKDLNCFHRNKTSKYGHRNSCKSCDKKYREANKEHCAELDKKYYEANKEHKAELSKKWYESNKEHCAERGKNWRGAYPERVRAIAAKRRSKKLNASPPWISEIDTMQIQDFYTLAKIHSEIMGKEYHVDHIHALQAPKVVMFEGEMMPLICGLHIPGNLQILTAEQNLQKSNKFIPYVFSECDFTQLWQV